MDSVTLKSVGPHEAEVEVSILSYSPGRPPSNARPGSDAWCDPGDDGCVDYDLNTLKITFGDYRDGDGDYPVNWMRGATIIWIGAHLTKFSEMVFDAYSCALEEN